MISQRAEAAEKRRHWLHTRVTLLLAGLLVAATGFAGCSRESPTLSLRNKPASERADPRELLAAPTPNAADGQPVAARRTALDEARVLVSELKYAQAAVRLGELVPVAELAGDEATASEAIFWLGYCAEKQGERQQAIDFYERLEQAYPKSRPAELARLRLKQLAPKADLPADKAGEAAETP